MFNPYTDSGQEIDSETIFCYDLVTYGHIVGEYSCGGMLHSDCLKVPMMCSCGAILVHAWLYPFPHPEIAEEVQKEF